MKKRTSPPLDASPSPARVSTRDISLADLSPVFIPQLSTVTCNQNLMLKVLAECRNSMPRVLVCRDSWSRTLHFP